MKTRIKLAAIVCSLLVLAACQHTKKATEADNKKLLQREWTLVAVSGVSKDEFAQLQSKPTLNIAETISGFGGCNRLAGGHYVLNGNEITISNLASTKKMCIGVAQKTEDALLAVLNNAKTYKVQGAHLTIFTADNKSAEFIALDKK